MSKGQGGSDHHKMSKAEENTYDTKEAHKLEQAFKNGKSLTDELNKIQKEHPEELRNIVYKIKEEEHQNTRGSEFLPKVTLTNNDKTIAFETSDKHHNPKEQRYVQMHLNEKDNKFEQDLGDKASSAANTGAKIAKAEWDETVNPELKKAREESEKAKTVIGAVVDPGGTSINNTISQAAKAADGQ